ncbi:MAG TPA: hypothetical protein VFF54_03440 [Thermodesulfobacteriota bacterium]|nr:hypothetical protein [Thermodesulfobacteriota bacterium]
MPSIIGKFFGYLPAADYLKRLCARLPAAIFLLAFFTLTVAHKSSYPKVAQNTIAKTIRLLVNGTSTATTTSGDYSIIANINAGNADVRAL